MICVLTFIFDVFGCDGESVAELGLKERPINHQLQAGT